MGYFAFDTPYWPYLFLFITGIVITYLCRASGLLLVERIDVKSDLFIFLRYASIALIAGILATLIIYPQGVFSLIPLWIRFFVIAVGLLVFMATRQNLTFGMMTSILTLVLFQVSFGNFTQ